MTTRQPPSLALTRTVSAQRGAFLRFEAALDGAELELLGAPGEGIFAHSYRPPAAAFAEFRVAMTAAEIELFGGVVSDGRVWQPRAGHAGR